MAVASGGTRCTLRGCYIIACIRLDHLGNDRVVLFVLYDSGECLDKGIGSIYQGFSLCEWPIEYDGNEHLSSIFLSEKRAAFCWIRAAAWSEKDQP